MQLNYHTQSMAGASIFPKSHGAFNTSYSDLDMRRIIRVAIKSELSHQLGAARNQACCDSELR